MAKLELDYMEYATDGAAQAAYVSSDVISWDLLDEDCSGIDDWSDGDTQDGVSEVNPAGQFHFYCPSANAGEAARRYRDIGEYPAQFTFEIKIYFDTLGTVAADSFDITLATSDVSVWLRFGSEGLFVFDGSGWNEVGDNIVSEGVWVTWRFLVDFTVAANATVDIYKDLDLVGNDVDCSWEYSEGEGYTELKHKGYTVNTESHIDYIKIATGFYTSTSNLQCYSEDTIKQQGSYSLKAIAAITDSLNDTLTKSGLSIDLSDKEEIKLWVYALRTGTNLQVQIHDSGGQTSTKDIAISQSNVWTEITWDISGISNVNKDDIDSIIIKVIEASATNTFYIDDMYAQDVALDNAVFFGTNF